ncbi:crossover junction endodeoxyribonuclease [Ralstonia phage Elie]|uniref:Crossover junction endodeoxyribonuclease RusA n=4 Tax=Bakolyvirus TaxID=2843355 RepID=A0A7G5BBN4_9CAUD|nr:RusA-like Holliday junction resolvase [Ralstonia phage Adzire]YP_010052807.1 RusA-like Holliday junction resolvase [Ralstonia phage Bakoly]YP_010077692.1 RusA-like Holliday junction resolvase [Ralstonia phage Simangalove]QMV32950.1 crossover junction endodeoxyribonuclease [Ralstonia phage Elie]QMV33512.1 crossover junction endodeoxyribonuclease [Ralstonia phage Jenny]QMV33662.1 crossover junction endodeoxyribonuclease [Ralstonia phage Sarlave]QMV32322.1 crossover junction endodeoxyribonucl
MLEFRSYTVPYPPSVNRIWRAVEGRVVLSKVGRDYYRKAEAHVLKPGRVPPAITGCCVVWVRLWMPDNRARDIDNPIKVLFDLLTRCKVWVDDSQVDELHVSRARDENGGRVDIIVQYN